MNIDELIGRLENERGATSQSSSHNVLEAELVDKAITVLREQQRKLEAAMAALENIAGRLQTGGYSDAFTFARAELERIRGMG